MRAAFLCKRCDEKSAHRHKAMQSRRFHRYFMVFPPFSGKPDKITGAFPRKSFSTRSIRPLHRTYHPAGFFHVCQI